MDKDILVISTKNELRDLIRSEASILSDAESNPEPEPGFGWVPNKDAITMLGRSKNTLQRWRTDGILPYSIIGGGSIYYRRADIESLLERNLRVAGEKVAQ